jgi:hypothetical protein
MMENIREEPSAPNEPQQHQGAGPKFESLRTFSNDGAEDVEIFKDIPEVSFCIGKVTHISPNNFKNDHYQKMRSRGFYII